MPFQDIPFTGLYSADTDERVPFGSALLCDDCWTDNDSVQGRSGARNAVTSSAAVGSGTVQKLARYRPSATSAKTVAVRGGAVSTITDPSSETAVDGTVSSVSTPFGSSANISAAQLGEFLYLMTDETSVAMQRMDSSYALTSLKSIDKPTSISQSKGSLAWFPYRPKSGSGDCSLVGTNCVVSTTASGLLSTWYAIVGTTGDTTQPASGAYVVVTLTATQDWRSANWIAFAVSPPDSGISGKEVSIEISADGTTYYRVGTIVDKPPIGGSPNLIFCNLPPISIPSETVLKVVKYIRYTVTNNNDGTKNRFALYGHLVLPARPTPQPVNYYIDFFDPTSFQQSQISEAVQVTIKDSDVSIPTYPDQFINSDSFSSSSAQLAPLDATNVRNFNIAAWKTYPKISDVGVQVTISGNVPSISGLTARLWKDTANGRREVNEVTGISSGAAYSITDNGGDFTLANSLYRPYGTAPRCNALAARAGRLIAAYGNRVYISSYTSPAATTTTASATINPYPQFPDIALSDADGWSFNIAPSQEEQIQGLENGDALYILTNENIYSMRSLVPGTDPYRIPVATGTMGRNSFCYADGLLYTAGYNGVYAINNRAQAIDLMIDNSGMYTSWFQPDSTTVVAYQNKKLLVVKGSKMMRFDFIKKRWSRHNLGFSVTCAARWKDPSGTKEQLWFFTSAGKVVRWQDTATSDDGTAIPDWTYSTGFDRPGVNQTGAKVYVDATGSVTAIMLVDMHETKSRSYEFPAGEDVHKLGAGLRGYKLRMKFKGRNTTLLRSAMWERDALDMDGVSG